MPDIYLASASPRRRTLLEQIGIDYRLLDVSVPEIPAASESAEQFARRLSLAKASAGAALLTDQQRRPVLGADTVVVIDGKILGKPCDRSDGLHMLELLSGRTHEVLSAVSIVAAELHTTLSRSSVTFRHTSAAERAAYWDSGEPVGKAGAYAIQGTAALFISHISGSYSGIMGLPLFETAQLLAHAGVDALTCAWAVTTRLAPHADNE
ncbi:MAG: septum formation inhibitor Maf [Pseudomonadota bacterium]|nr:MAG: septum formation inhibitor Maf [Pseudomonadota bacterium]